MEGGSEMVKDKNERMFWNIVKAIGIISIVIGHSCTHLVKFVYFYHLAIFFFIGGALYNESKYGKDPYLNIYSKLKNNWKKYALFGIFFTLIHNFLFKHGLIINTNFYTFKDILTSCLNTLLFFGTETMGGALWFVPVFILSSALFGFLIYYSNKISDNFSGKSKEEIKNAILFGSTLFCAILGLYLNTRNISLMLHIQTIFLVAPFFTFGYFFRNKIAEPQKKLNILSFLLALIFLMFIYFKVNIFIDLSSNKIGNPYLFYIISFAGIYCCLYLAKVILNLKIIAKISNKIGTYSYEIMGLHFLIFKVIDYSYAKITGVTDPIIYGVFPYAFKSLAPFYVLLGVSLPVIIFMIFDKLKKIILNNKNKISEILNNMYKKISSIFHSKVSVSILILLVLIAFGYPIIKLGIMHNDELMSRYWSLQGFIAFYKHYFVEQIQKGRALSSIIIPFSMYLGFLGQKTITFKIGQILSIILTVYLFSKLLKKVFKSEKFALLYFGLFIAFLPITFEPTVPSVFVTFYNLSICFLIISFSLYYDYLKTGKNSKLILSMIIFFLVETTYESFITYTVVYVLLALYEFGFKNMKKNLKAFIVPIFVGVLYLGLYIISSKIFPSNYDGNQITGINILTSLKIIYTLVKNVLPGSYLVSGKYQWLYTYYYNLNLKDVLIIIVSVIIFIAIIYIGTLKSKKVKDYNTLTLLKTTILGIMLIVLPILPISVAAMYQKPEICQNLVALPVSYFSYFGSILILSSIIKFLSSKYENYNYLVILLLAFSIFGVQLLNNVISKEANNNFRRLEEIEEFVSSKDLLNKFKNDPIYSTDIFTTKNTLVIHDSYWNEFASLHEVSTRFINDFGNKNDVKLYYDEINHIFILNKENLYYAITKKILDNNMFIDWLLEENFKLLNKENLLQIDNWNIYYFMKKNDRIVNCQNNLNNDKVFDKCIVIN